MSKTFTDSTNRKTFYSVRDGRIVHEVQEGTEGATPRVVEKGKRAGQTVYELHEGGIEGKITGVSFEVKDFGGKKSKEVQIEIDDDAQLQFNEKIYLSKLAEKLPLTDFDKEVKICFWKSKKGSTIIDFYQDGEKLGNYYTDWEQGDDEKWTPTLKNGLPEVAQDELGEPDFRDRDTFIKKEMITLLDGVFGSDVLSLTRPF